MTTPVSWCLTRFRLRVQSRYGFSTNQNAYLGKNFRIAVFAVAESKEFSLTRAIEREDFEKRGGALSRQATVSAGVVVLKHSVIRLASPVSLPLPWALSFEGPVSDAC